MHYWEIIELVVDRQLTSILTSKTAILHNFLGNNFTKRNITNINLFEHINLLWTNIRKWWNSLRTEKQTNILTSRAAITAKTISESFRLYIVKTASMET